MTLAKPGIVPLVSSLIDSLGCWGAKMKRSLIIRAMVLLAATAVFMPRAVSPDVLFARTSGDERVMVALSLEGIGALE